MGFSAARWFILEIVTIPSVIFEKALYIVLYSKKNHNPVDRYPESDMSLYIKGRDGSAKSLREKSKRHGRIALGQGIYSEPGDDLSSLVFSE